MAKIQQFGTWCIWLPPCCVPLITLTRLITQTIISGIQFQSRIRQVIERCAKLGLNFCVVLFERVSLFKTPGIHGDALHIGC